jgi:hypothetical protein
MIREFAPLAKRDRRTISFRDRRTQVAPTQMLGWMSIEKAGRIMNSVRKARSHPFPGRPELVNNFVNNFWLHHRNPGRKIKLRDDRARVQVPASRSLCWGVRTFSLSET